LDWIRFEIESEFNSIQFDSIVVWLVFATLRLCLCLCLVQFNSIGFNSIGFDSIGFDWIQFDSIGFNSIGFDSIQTLIPITNTDYQ